MSRKPDYRIPVGCLHIVWVRTYYDFPRAGTCRIGGEMMRFELDAGNDHSSVYHVFRMTRAEKVRAWIKQKTFEFCVGTHWTYEGRSRRNWMKRRRPRLFWQAVMSVYYRRWIEWY